MNKTAKILSIIASFLVVTFLFIYLNYSLKIQYQGLAKENTFIENIDVSGLTRNQIEKELEKVNLKLVKNKISLSLVDKNLLESYENLGLKVDIQSTIEQIDFFEADKVNIISILFSDNSPKKIQLKTSLDTEKLYEQILRLNYLDLTPSNATIELKNSKPEIVNEKNGVIIDFTKLHTDLKSAFLSEDNEYRIQTIPKKPHITAETLSSQLSKFEAALNKQITLIDPVYSDDWYIKLINNPNWIYFDNNNGYFTGDEEKKKNLELKINTEEFNKFIDAEIAQWLDKPAEPLVLTINEDGEISSEGKGNTGYKIKRNELEKQLIEVAFETEKNEITIPVEFLESQLKIPDSIQEMGIKDVLSIGHTSYYGSPANRIHNIKVGAEKFKGVTLQPGDEFSFNTILGPVNGATGYRKELVIKPEGTIPEYGGGLCQVSTTTYRAALLAGLDITNRREHSYAVSYYSQILGHGLDATIYIGGQDLQFKNNTEAPIYIHTYVDNDYELYFVFLGTSDGRTVELEGPEIGSYRSPGPAQYIETDTLPAGMTKQVEKSHSGFSVLWKRHITDAEGNKTTEEIKTNYKAVPAKILVGTGE